VERTVGLVLGEATQRRAAEDDPRAVVTGAPKGHRWNRHTASIPAGRERRRTAVSPPAARPAGWRCDETRPPAAIRVGPPAAAAHGRRPRSAPDRAGSRPASPPQRPRAIATR